MNRSILEQPFDAALVKTRKGHSGQTITYVEGTEYIRRLNEAFESQWSFEIIEHHIRDAEVIVLARITADGITKTAFGGSPITVSRDTGEVISLADDLKAAATDSLKKACSLLGIGLHLYAENGRTRAEVSTEPHKPPASSDTGSNGGNGTRGKAEESNCRTDGLTSRQISAIYSMGHKLRLTDAEIQQRTMGGFNCLPENMSKKDASALIGQLKKQLDQWPAAGATMEVCG